MASMNSGSQRGPPRGKGGRHNARGGIQKAGQAQPRVDRDGDLNMDGPVRGRGAPRGARSSSTSQNRNGAREDTRKSSRPARNPFATVKRALTQQDGPTKQSGAARFAAAMEQASKGFHKPVDRSNLRQPSERSQLSQITIRGWSKSKAASNPGGCQQQLIDFIERKASHNPGQQKGVRIFQSHVDGDTLTISVGPEFVPSVLHLDGFTFAGAPLSIKEMGGAPRDQKMAQDKAPALSESGMELKDRIKSMLERRYNAEHKLLDLSSLGTDPEFANSGIFDSASTQSKFFPALMKVCGDAAPSAAQKREMVVSVALSNNNLPDVSTVTTLAQTFPDIKNLDLSNNSFRDLKSLEAWRRRFRSLELLVLTGNPIETLVPNYHEEIVRWFPTLRALNGVQVRTEEQVAAASNGKLVIPVGRPCFQDESSIGENFLTFFFPAFDTDRANLVTSFYDSQASFSYSVNVSAKRLEERTADWGQYIKMSRNMLKITSFGGRKARLSKGTEQIKAAWGRIPATRHPDLARESDKWCIECHPIAGLPDPNTSGGPGVGGLIIYVHGEFGEVDVSKMEVTVRRSFDRTFILGPGGGLGGIRVISDMMVLRAYGGTEAFKPNDETNTTLPVPAASANLLQSSTAPSIQQPQQAQQTQQLAHVPIDTTIPPGLNAPPGFAQPQPGKPDDQLAKERTALELSRRTRLTLDFARMCLEQNDWNLEMAGQAYLEAKAGLGPEAYY